MKKSFIACILFVFSLAGLSAQESFTLSAEFSIAFGTVETESTEGSLMVTGYGIGESMNRDTALSRARMKAMEQIGQQAAGVDFLYEKTDSSVIFQFYFTDQVSGARLLSSHALPSNDAAVRVLAIVGGEMPVVLPVGANVSKVSVSGTGSDIENVMTDMMKEAVRKAAAGLPQGGQTAKGILYLSNLTFAMGK